MSKELNEYHDYYDEASYPSYFLEPRDLEEIKREPKRWKEFKNEKPNNFELCWVLNNNSDSFLLRFNAESSTFYGWLGVKPTHFMTVEKPTDVSDFQSIELVLPTSYCKCWCATKKDRIILCDFSDGHFSYFEDVEITHFKEIIEPTDRP